MTTTSGKTLGRLTFSLNVSLDGCYDHRAFGEETADDELHQDAADLLGASEGILMGRVTYELMESAWPQVAKEGNGPPAIVAFARRLDAMPKYVVSNTRKQFDWNNTFLMESDLAKAVAILKAKHPGGVGVGGPRLATSLARLGLIDDYRILVHPVVVGHGPRLLEGIEQAPRLKLIDSKRFKSGVTVLHYRVQQA